MPPIDFPEIIKIRSQPGIKRDGTRLDGENYVDGQWVRFQRGLPRKIGGYRALNKSVEGLVNTLHAFTSNEDTYVHAGSPNQVERFFLDSSLAASVISDRTPTSGFTADDDNMWTFDVIYMTGSGNQIVAQVAPNRSEIVNRTGGEVFYGDLLSTTALASITLPAGWSATGGILALAPYTLFFGNDGFVGWSVPSDPTDLIGAGSGSANITSQKIVAARRLRGGPGASPSALLWSADSLMRASFVGGTAVFDFDTLADDIPLLSSKCVIEYDGVFYWIGTDRFLMFNGVVREVPNDMNGDFFFDNLNYSQRQAVYAFKVPRFGEIWWCFPTGTSEVANHAIIFNVRENAWYDTPLPDGGRAAAVSPSLFRYPIMSGVDEGDYQADTVAIDTAGTGYTAGDVLTLTGGIYSIQVQATVTTVGGGGDITAVALSNAGQYTTTPGTNALAVTGGSGSGALLDLTWKQPYRVWVHEIGYDKIDGLSVNPIQSYFETGDVSLPAQMGVNKDLSVSILEPDFVQTGDLLISVRGRQNARAPEVDGDPITIPETASTSEEEIGHFKTSRRELRFRVESNTLGGYYEMGLVLAHVRPGDGRITS